MSRTSGLMLICLLLPFTAQSAEVYVPDELQGWENWVLHEREYRDCPFYFNSGAAAQGDFVCAWPGLLDIAIAANGGRFSQHWSVYAEDAWLPLPGSGEHWPHEVTVNGDPAVVVERNGFPAVRVAPGRHRLAGSFGWDERPGVLPIPAQSGLVALSIDGKRVDRPERHRARREQGRRDDRSKDGRRDVGQGAT